MSRLDAIDTSHYNTLEDKAKLPQLVLALAKISESDNQQDAAAAASIAAYRSSPQIQYVGGYLFMHRGDGTTAFAVKQAQNFIATAAGKLGPNDVVMIDWERDYAGMFPTGDQIEAARAVLVKAYTFWRVWVYCANWVTGFTSWRAANPGVPLVYANYGPQGHLAASQFKACMLQYTDAAIVPGFSAPIDGSEMLDLTPLHNIHAPKAPPPTKPAAVWPLFLPSKGKFGLWPIKKDKPTIKKGATGDAVKYLQSVISFKAGGAIVIDGKFGDQTTARVTDVQRLLGVTVDGIVGSETWGAVDFLARRVSK